MSPVRRTTSATIPTVQVGDIVHLGIQPEYWVVVELERVEFGRFPCERPARIRKLGARDDGIWVGPEQLSRPPIDDGKRVRHVRDRWIGRVLGPTATSAAFWKVDRKTSPRGIVEACEVNLVVIAEERDWPGDARAEGRARFVVDEPARPTVKVSVEETVEDGEHAGVSIVLSGVDGKTTCVAVLDNGVLELQHVPAQAAAELGLELWTGKISVTRAA